MNAKETKDAKAIKPAAKKEAAPAPKAKTVKEPAKEIKKVSPKAQKPEAKPDQIKAVKQELKKVQTKPEIKEAKKSAPRVKEEKVVKAKKEGALERNLRKTRIGVVVSNKMDKTIVVAIQNNVRHPIYKKIVKSTKKFKAHDEKNECNVGDKVEIAETRHISKDKYFRLVNIIERAK